MSLIKLTLGAVLGVSLLSTGSVSFAQNLLTNNASFESALSLNPGTAEIGFITDYTEIAYDDTSGFGGLYNNNDGEGRYAITNADNAEGLHFAAGLDVDTVYSAQEGNNFFMANGADVANTLLWQYSSSVTVVGNQQYDFSAWVSVWSDVSRETAPQDQRPSFVFEVAQSSDNGTTFGSFTSVGSFFTDNTLETGTWEQKTATFTTASNTNAIQVRIRNTNTLADGNDFGLDNISLQPVPATDGITSLGIGGFVCLMGHLQMRRRKAAKAQAKKD